MVHLVSRENINKSTCSNFKRFNSSTKIISNVRKFSLSVRRNVRGASDSSHHQKFCSGGSASDKPKPLTAKQDWRFPRCWSRLSLLQLVTWVWRSGTSLIRTLGFLQPWRMILDQILDQIKRNQEALILWRRSCWSWSSPDRSWTWCCRWSWRWS